jgi:hypothetical protein
MASKTSFSFGSQVATIDRPTESGLTPFLRNVATNSGEGSGPRGASFFVAGSKSNAPFSATTRSKRSILGKNAYQVGQLSARDQKKLPAGPPEGDQRVCGCVIDDSVMRKRTVVVGCQTADVHAFPARFPHGSQANVPGTIAVPNNSVGALGRRRAAGNNAGPSRI